MKRRPVHTHQNLHASHDHDLKKKKRRRRKPRRKEIIEEDTEGGESGKTLKFITWEKVIFVTPENLPQVQPCLKILTIQTKNFHV